MPEEPTLGEVSRRLDEQGRRMDEGFRELNKRLSDQPTEKTLLALLATKDAQINALANDVVDVSKALAQERAERLAGDDKLRSELIAGDKAIEERANRAKTIAWAAAGVLSAGFIGVLALIVTSGGVGT